jgi:hypothetical protein
MPAPSKRDVSFADTAPEKVPGKAVRNEFGAPVRAFVNG